jgi:hypothetical protein
MVLSYLGFGIWVIPLLSQSPSTARLSSIHSLYGFGARQLGCFSG